METDFETGEAKARFVRPEEWAVIKAQIIDKLREKDHKHNERSSALRNLEEQDKVRNWYELSMVLIRSECLTTKDICPIESTFDSMISLINRVLGQVSATDEDLKYHFVEYNKAIPYQLGSLIQAKIKSLPAETSSEQMVLIKHADIRFLCLVKRPKSPAERIGSPVQQQLPNAATPPQRSPLFPDAIEKLGTLVVATTEWDPFIQYHPDGRTTGIYCDLLKDLARTRGLKIVCKLLEPTAAIKGIQDGTINCALGFCDTPSRRRMDLKFVAYIHMCEFLAVINAARCPSVKNARELVEILEAQKQPYRMLVRKDSAGHDVAIDMLGIHKDLFQPNGTQQPIKVLNELFSEKEEEKFAVAAISDGITLQKFIDKNRRTRRNLRMKVLPSIATLRSGFMIHSSEIALAEWLIREVPKIIKSQRFKEKEKAILKRYSSFAQQFWASGWDTISKK